jgi:hypothetical protein
LFGTADAKDVKRLMKICDDFHVFKADMTHATEQQMTYIRALDRMTKQNVMDTIELAKALRDSVGNFSLRLNRVEADLLDTQEAMMKQMRYSAAIREIKMAMVELRFNMIQLQESLDVKSIGKLSSVLINPQNLSIILQQVSLQLPAGLTMLTGLTVEEMYVYYTVAEVHAVATSTSIRLFIDIPLKAADRYFELYQVHSLPFFHKSIGKFIMIDEAFTYLAVAEEGQFFAMLTPQMLSKCTQNVYRVCPSDMVLRTAGEQNCLIALFLGKVDTVFAKCKRLILNETFEPVWIRSPNFDHWIYSLSSPQRVTIKCRVTGPPPNPLMNYQAVLDGTGVLLNSSTCYVYAENFKLLPHSVGMTTVDLTKSHIILPNIKEILHYSEERLLQVNSTDPIDVQRVDSIIERATSRASVRGFDLDRVASTLQYREVSDRSSYVIWILSLVLVLAGLGILWLVWGNTAKMYFCHWRRAHSHASVDNNLDKQGIQKGMLELQVVGTNAKEGVTGTEGGGAEKKAGEKPS